MTKPITRIHDLETGEVIDREMTDEEYALYQEDITAAQEQQAKENTIFEAKEVAQAKLAALGLTTDDLAALGL